MIQVTELDSHLLLIHIEHDELAFHLVSFSIGHIMHHLMHCLAIMPIMLRIVSASMQFSVD